MFISPKYGIDNGSNGGIARVVEAQRAMLGNYDIELVDDVAQAELIAMHAGSLVRLNNSKQAVVAHCHGLYWEDYDNWDRWAVELNKEVIKALKISDACTAPSEWVANALRRGMWLNPEVINHGVDCEAFTPPDGPDLGYVFWNKSRVDPVCDVVPCEMLAGMAKDVRFISTFGHRQTNLEVCGIMPPDTMYGLLRYAGVYLCNSRETFGIGTLEALACGVPVLGWNWGGQAEIIQHKVNGWLSTPGDFENLKQGLYYIKEHRAEMSAAARKLALTYNWERFIEQYARLYHETYDRLKTSKRVSVIITSYNLKQFLPDAINSVWPQLSEDDELIVVDDCSTDGSLELAQSFEQAKVIKTPSNLYLAGALNYAIEQAQGQYILPLDADNMLNPGAIETLANSLDADRDLDIAYGKLEVVEDDGRRSVSSWPPIQADVDAQLAHKNQICSSSLYRRRVWERVGGYRRRCRTGEDADFWCRALSFGFSGRRVTDAVTLTYRNRADSMSHVEHDWPWEAWYANFSNNYACTPATQHSNVPSYEPPIISVIIPVGPGHEERVIDAIDSLSAQSFIKWECIVVNDSGHELKVPSFVKVISTPRPGSGVSVARNMGLDAARGRCFVPLDADDYLDSTALIKFYTAYSRHQGYVYSDYRIVEEQEARQVPNQCCNQVKDMLVHPITGLYPLVKEARFDENFKVGEDWDFVVNMTAQGYCGSRIPEPLVYYRTTSGTNRNELLENIDIYRSKINRKYGSVSMCGCAKGGNVILSAEQVLNQHLAKLDLEDQDPELVLIEFIPDNIAPLTYRGRATGRTYRFGSGADSVKYVDRRDAEYFLTRSMEFRLYDRELARI